MSSASPIRSILVSACAWATAGAAVTLLAACGQRGPLTIPQTPAAAQRATLPQTVWGGHSTPPAAPASGASAPAPVLRPPPPLLPDLPDIE
ncbi:lipoprotein [Ottowia sp. GY511]|uniref:Lipoprotein n=1 Tax=Ottowia flava TaxID=2675430 RepID=A0ABW4KVH3_9BURK|nr:lipoprotein [Ottowia sp. GY511]TXK31376.1 lipoprotein [Ottowia sp. GY511]